jgi:hypothetical protein
VRLSAPGGPHHRRHVKAAHEPNLSSRAKIAKHRPRSHGVPAPNDTNSERIPTVRGVSWLSKWRAATNCATIHWPSSSSTSNVSRFTRVVSGRPPDCPRNGGVFPDPHPHLTVGSRIDAATADSIEHSIAPGKRVDKDSRHLLEAVHRFRRQEQDRTRKATHCGEARIERFDSTSDRHDIVCGYFVDDGPKRMKNRHVRRNTTSSHRIMQHPVSGDRRLGLRNDHHQSRPSHDPDHTGTFLDPRRGSAPIGRSGAERYIECRYSLLNRHT